MTPAIQAVVRIARRAAKPFLNLEALGFVALAPVQNALKIRVERLRDGEVDELGYPIYVAQPGDLNGTRHGEALLANECSRGTREAQRDVPDKRSSKRIIGSVDSIESIRRLPSWLC